MKHPALTKVMSAALAVMCLVMIGFGAFKIADARENREKSLEAAQNLETKINNYTALSEELAASTVDYDSVSREQTELREQYNSDNSKHRAELAEFTATKGGTAMGSLALDEAAYAIQMGWKMYYAGLDELNSQLGDYTGLLELLPTAEELAGLQVLIDTAKEEVDISKTRMDELQAKLDSLREEGVSEITLAELRDIIAELFEEKRELELEESEIEALRNTANAAMAIVESVRASMEADESILPENFDEELERRVIELTGKTVEDITAELQQSEQRLAELRASIDEINRRIEEADGDLEQVTVTLDELQQGLDEARIAYEEANAKLAELQELYDNILMATQAKTMMEEAAFALEKGQAEVDTAWYKLQQTKKDFSETEQRLESEREQLQKDHEELTRITRTVDEYEDLTARHKAARTALVLYPDIKAGVDAGGEVADSAQTALLSMRENAEREFKGRLAISILCLAAGVFGLLTLPEAFERVRTYPTIHVFTILSFLCASGAECLGMCLGWGQTYAALFGALFALLLLSVCGKAKRPTT